MAKRIIEVELSKGASRHHEHIEWVTWKDDAGGPPTREKREVVAKRIHDGGERHYYTKAGGFTADVEAYQRNGTWFIKTKADQSKEDNLLSLVK